MFKRLPNVDPELTGKRIKELREKRHFTQKDVADYFGYTTVAVSRWETGKTVPKVDNLLALSWLYNVPMEEIIRIERIGANRGEDERSSPLPYFWKDFIRRNIKYRGWKWGLK